MSYHKFQPYFNQSLGIWIETPEQLRKLEKEGTIFMSLTEYEQGLKKIKKEKKEKKDRDFKNEMKKNFSQIKWGRSFAREEKEGKL